MQLCRASLLIPRPGFPLNPESSILASRVGRGRLPRISSSELPLSVCTFDPLVAVDQQDFLLPSESRSANHPARRGSGFGAPTVPGTRSRSPSRNMKITAKVSRLLSPTLHRPENFLLGQGRPSASPVYTAPPQPALHSDEATFETFCKLHWINPEGEMRSSSFGDSPGFVEDLTRSPIPDIGSRAVRQCHAFSPQPLQSCTRGPCQVQKR